MLQAKAEDDAREQRKQAAKQEAADRKAGVPVVKPPQAVVAQPAPVALPPASPAKPAAPRRPAPATAAVEPPSSRKAKRRERSKALKAKKAARRKRGRDDSDGEEPALRPEFGETAKAPINVTLKTKHWGDASRLGAMFERQLATARARALTGAAPACRLPTGPPS